MQAGCETADGPRIAGGAHTLKGAAGCFGAQSVARLAENVELLARENQLDSIAAALCELNRQADLLQHALDEFVSARS